jgi:hypothetical protein
VLFGNRFHGGPHRVLYFWRYVANRGISEVLAVSVILAQRAGGGDQGRETGVSCLRGFAPILRAHIPGRQKITWRGGFAGPSDIVRYRFFY